MTDTPDPTLDRLGAVAGLVAVILLLALFTVLPSLPSLFPHLPAGDVRKSTVSIGPRPPF